VEWGITVPLSMIMVVSNCVPSETFKTNHELSACEAQTIHYTSVSRDHSLPLPGPTALTCEIGTTIPVDTRSIERDLRSV